MLSISLLLKVIESYPWVIEAVCDLEIIPRHAVTIYKYMITTGSLLTIITGKPSGA